MVTLPMTRDGRVTVLPGVSLVVAIGVWIARSQVLAIRVRVELRPIAGILDNGLRQCGSYGSRRSRAAAPINENFILGLLVGLDEEEDGNARQFCQRNSRSDFLNFNLMAPTEGQTYLVFTQLTFS
jgi:hypothetical protein